MYSKEASYNHEYLAIIDELDGDDAGRRSAWERMGRGTSFWDGKPTAFSYLPRLFSRQSRERLGHTAQMTYRILVKAIERYQTDEAFRREFRLDPRVEELVLLPRRCAEPLPFARVDFAYNEETGAVRAIEFNTDSSSGMNENREALRALRDTEPFKRFAASHKVYDDVDQQFAGWIERFAALRAQAGLGEHAADGAGAAGARDVAGADGAGGAAGAAGADGAGGAAGAAGAGGTGYSSEIGGADGTGEMHQTDSARETGKTHEITMHSTDIAHKIDGACKANVARKPNTGTIGTSTASGKESNPCPVPHMALVACLDSPNPDIGELEAYRDLFEQAGIPCSVFDVRQLEFDGQHLVGRTALAGPSNVAIDCVWRWLIVVDLLEHWNDVQPFIAAVRAQKVELIGSFATQIAHDKQLFAVLHRQCAATCPSSAVDASAGTAADVPMTAPATTGTSLGTADTAAATAPSWLTPDELAFVRNCIPFTAFLDDPALDFDAIRRDRARWVVKPTDWYESKRVVAGRDCTQQEWESTLNAYKQEIANGAASPYIVQEFCAPYETPAIPIRGHEEDFTAAPATYGNIVGLYLQAGTFAGAYVRQGPHAVIGSAREGLVTPVLWVD